MAQEPKRVSFASELSTIDADIGTEIWVESERRFYKAYPSYQYGGVAGPSDSSPITWVPDDGVLATQTIEDGGSATVLWSQDIPEATIVEVEAKLSLFSGEAAGVASKIANGTLVCVAHRHGSGTLAIDSQEAGVPWVLTDSDWDPVFDTSSNTLRLVVTPDASQLIDGTVAVSVKTTDTSGTQEPDITPLD